MYTRIEAIEESLGKEQIHKNIKMIKLTINLNKLKIKKMNKMRKFIDKEKENKKIILMWMKLKESQRETSLKEFMSFNKICNSKGLKTMANSHPIHLMKDKKLSKL